MDRTTIGMLADIAGVKVTTVRYYERAGLMPPPARTAGRQRNYTNDHRERLLFICKARQLEFSIEDIKTLLMLAEPAQISCRNVQHVAVAHLQALRQKITRLVKLEALLAGAIAQCSGMPNPPCPVLELLGTTE
jgi:MerR family transcriptional regulator, mercuric resistance operon regulatory protein